MVQARPIAPIPTIVTRTVFSMNVSISLPHPGENGAAQLDANDSLNITLALAPNST